MHPAKPVEQSSGGIWSDGKMLVVHKQAKLPLICVKTNEPAEKTIQRTFYWHSPLVYFLILLNIIIYFIGAMLTRKSHKLGVPISQDIASRRTKSVLLCWLFAMLSIGLIVFGFYMVSIGNSNFNSTVGICSVIGGFVTLIASAVIGSRKASILVAKKITDHATWFKGANPEFVRRFPPIPPHPTH